MNDNDLIPLHSSRCTGTFDLMPYTPPCDRREACAHYVQIGIDAMKNRICPAIPHCHRGGFPTLYRPVHV